MRGAIISFLLLLLIGGVSIRATTAVSEEITFVIAEDEYDADRTLPVFANELEKTHGFSCTVLLGGDNYIAGLEALVNTDLLVLYVRRNVLPPEQMDHLRDYIQRGKPLVGLRTTSHAFQLREEALPTGFEEWPEFDKDVLGGNYHDHHGNNPETGPFTYIWSMPNMVSHPVLAGIPSGELRVPSWLYKTSPLGKNTKILMMGRVSDRKPYEPVAWLNTNKHGGQVFYTSLGHPDDFRIPTFRQLLLNGIYFVLGKPLAPKGTISNTQLAAIKSYRFGDTRRALTHIEALRIVEPYFSDAMLKEEAAAVAVKIGFEIRDAAQFENEEARHYVKDVMEEVLSFSQNERTVEKAQEAIENINKK